MLLVGAAKQHRAAVARRLSPLGLHIGQDLLLLELEARGGVSQRELAARLGVEQPTVGVALRRLEAAGFVQRRPAPHDGRVRLVFLTPQGRVALPHVHRAWQDAEQVVTGRLSVPQARQLRTLLTTVSLPIHPIKT